jgi:hypothetical protein
MKVRSLGWMSTIWQFRRTARNRSTITRCSRIPLADGAVMMQALEPVIANRLESHAPLVHEGDFILPAMAAESSYDDIPAAGQVRGCSSSSRTKRRSLATT